MDDEFLNEYLKTLKTKIPNNDFIIDLKNEIENIDEKGLEELIKKHF